MGLQVFMLPDLGEGLVEAELVTWLVSVGESVHVDQPIAEVETAKSVVEVPSPYEGVVDTLHAEEGETMEVGKPLISIAAVGAQGSGTEPVEAVDETPSGSGNVLIGYGTSDHGGTGRSRPSRSQRMNQHSAAVAPAPAAPAQPLAQLVVSPLVRKMARDAGLSLTEIAGSGTDGLIMRRDVTEAVAANQATAPQTEHLASSIPLSGSPLAESAGSVSVSAKVQNGVLDPRTGLRVLAQTPLSGAKKAASAALARSRREIPEATVWLDVDATALMELRAAMKAKHGAAPGVLAFVARFVTAGLARFPQLNTQLLSADGTESVVEFDGINLGFAAQTERGLVVPVLRNAEGRSARELDAALRTLTETARSGKAGPALLSGGTFTVNNYGVFGVDGSAAIINYPEAAMLGLGRILDKPWVVDGELCVRKMTELTLAFDHRVCDGAVAAGFLRFVADAIENPAGALADL